jgi:hypothetical protein
MLVKFWENRHEAKKARTIEFAEFLRSAEGRRAIFDLAPDMLVNSKVTAILNDVRVQLEALAARETEAFTLFIETNLETGERRFTDEIAQFKQDLAKKTK